MWTWGEGTAPTVKTRVPAKPHTTPVKEFKYQMNGRGGGGSSQLLPYASEDRKAARRHGPGRQRPQGRALRHSPPGPCPQHTAERKRQPRARRPRPSPARPRAHPEDKVKEDQDGFGGGDTALPHRACRPSASGRPARLGSAPLSSAPLRRRPSPT